MNDFELGIVLLWIFCGLVAAAIGARKREGCLAFIIGVGFGPVGILIALISKGKRERCPYCKKFIDNEATVCPYCQRTITFAEERE